MLTQRTNPHFKRPSEPAVAPAILPVASPPKPPRGDIIYGAESVAKFIFEFDHSDKAEVRKARRRVYNLWEYFKSRGEDKQVGFTKIKGALCLSKSQWTAYQGFGG